MELGARWPDKTYRSRSEMCRITTLQASIAKTAPHPSGPQLCDKKPLIRVFISIESAQLEVLQFRADEISDLTEDIIPSSLKNIERAGEGLPSRSARILEQKPP